MFKTVASVLIAGFFCSASFADSLTVSCVPVMGNRAHSHAVAIWIEDNAGRFVKTLTRCSNEFYFELQSWMAKSNGDTMDAVTSATLVTYDTTISGTWNIKKADGTVAARGDYWYCIEMANWGSPAVLVKSKIAIDGISKTRTVVDSAQNSASTFITQVKGVYGASPVSVEDGYHPAGRSDSAPPRPNAGSVHGVSINGRLLPGNTPERGHVH